MKWLLRKHHNRWWLVGSYVHVFDTWEEAINWLDLRRYSEPTA